MQDTVNKDRDKYIGGSDIPIIMNLSPFKSRFDLLLEKAGYKADEFTGNVYTDYGNALEPLIRDYINAGLKDKFFEGKHTREAEEIGETIGIRVHTDGENSDTVLEVKTTSQIYESVNDYKAYLVQLLYGMIEAQKPYGLLAVYERPEDLSIEFNSARLHLYNITYNEYEGTLVNEMRIALKHFVDDLVRVKDNPLITESELLPQEIPDITARILAFESQLAYFKKVEQTIKSEKDRLKKVMEACGVKTFKTPNGYRLTLVEDTPPKAHTTTKLNEDKLKAEHPRIYAKYLEQKTGFDKGRAGFVKITAPSAKEEAKDNDGNN